MQIILLSNTSSNQTITVQARNFLGIVPIEIVLTPESGDRFVQAASIDMRNGDPAQVTVTMPFPANTPTRVTAWTKF